MSHGAGSSKLALSTLQLGSVALQRALLLCTALLADVRPGHLRAGGLVQGVPALRAHFFACYQPA